MKLFTKKADIIAAIEDIRATGKKLDDMIQVAACSVLGHLDAHGDITLVNTLVDAMPKGSRVNALRDFILNFGKVKFNDQSKAFEYDRAAETDMVGAQATPWTDFKPEAPYVAFDLKALIAGVLKKADAASKDADHKDEVDFELLAQLRAVMEVPAELEGTL